MNLIGYARVVPDADADEALKHQEAVIEKYARENGHTLIGMFKEQVSGDLEFPKCRPILVSAIERLKSDIGLIVVRLNRLSGRIDSLQNILVECDRRGAPVLAVQGPQAVREMSSGFEVTALRNDPG